MHFWHFFAHFLKNVYIVLLDHVNLSRFFYFSPYQQKTYIFNVLDPKLKKSIICILFPWFWWPYESDLTPKMDLSNPKCFFLPTLKPCTKYVLSCSSVIVSSCLLWQGFPPDSRSHCLKGADWKVQLNSFLLQKSGAYICQNSGGGSSLSSQVTGSVPEVTKVVLDGFAP